MPVFVTRWEVKTHNQSITDEREREGEKEKKPRYSDQTALEHNSNRLIMAEDCSVHTPNTEIEEKRLTPL